MSRLVSIGELIDNGKSEVDGPFWGQELRNFREAHGAKEPPSFHSGTRWSAPKRGTMAALASASAKGEPVGLAEFMTPTLGRDSGLFQSGTAMIGLTLQGERRDCDCINPACSNPANHWYDIDTFDDDSEGV